MARSATRALAAVRFVDRATDAPISGSLRVAAPNARAVFNRSGLWVVCGATGIPADAPDSIAAGSLTLRAEVFDEGGRYAPRAFSLTLPRRLHGTPDLAQPIDVDLPAAPTLPLRATWAAARVRVRFAPTAAAPDGTPIQGALVRLEEVGSGRFCHALTNALGEALAVASRLPRFAPGETAETIFQPSVAHTVTVVVERAATDARTGAQARVPDPDDLWTRRASLLTASRSIELASGRQHNELFDVARV
jgi:hypothetical protein